MNFDTFISDNYTKIKSICKRFDRINYEDLCHDVIIKLRDEQGLFDAIEKSKENAYLWIVIKNEYLNKAIKEINTINIDDCQINCDDEIDYTLELNEIIAESDLSHIERLWIKAFLDRGLNASWVESSTGISRQHAKERFDYIINKLIQ